MSFYNTINLEGQELQVAERKAMSQEYVVIEIFKFNHGRIYNSPSEVMEIAERHYNRKCPLTSWLRAMTNLTARNILIKTLEKRVGPYGTPEHYWKLNRVMGQQKLFE